MSEVIVGVDIGSSKVCTVLGELNKNNQLQILGVGTAECRGLKKGIIIDIDNAVEAIKSSINQAERMSDMEIESVFINFSGGHVDLKKNRGIIAVSGEDKEITIDDVERVLQEARTINLPVDREIIGIIPLHFIVDGYENIKDPVGMIGVRLEVEAYIITALTASIQNLVRSVERCDIEVSGIIIDPLASGEIILSKEEKELGVALVDIGGEITDISIFRGSTLVYTKLINIGGGHITNDISIGLKIPVSEAEILKRQYGYASISMLKSIENIPINSVGLNSPKTVTNKELTNIIEARVQEIYYLINKEIELSGMKDSLTGGVVITGGGTSFIKGTLEAATSIIGLPVRIGTPQYIGVASPIYSTAAGMVRYILANRKYDSTSNYMNDKDSAKGNGLNMKKQNNNNKHNIIGKIKKFFSDFF